MKRTLITPSIESFPKELQDFLRGADIYDSSCSKEAKVFFIDKDAGYYLKKAKKGELKKEALLTEYFSRRRLCANVISYVSKEEDFLLCERVPGEDCTYEKYLQEPKKLCDTIAEAARFLHGLDFTDCPIQDRVGDYLKTVYENYEAGIYDTSLGGGYPKTAKEAIALIEDGKALLKSDTLIHGDFCLPNIMLDSGRFSGFIDLGGGGVGDKHIDLFWGAWTLYYNLGTDKYRERFFDAYGRESIDSDALYIVKLAEAFG